MEPVVPVEGRVQPGATAALDVPDPLGLLEVSLPVEDALREEWGGREGEEELETTTSQRGAEEGRPLRLLGRTTAHLGVAVVVVRLWSVLLVLAVEARPPSPPRLALGPRLLAAFIAVWSLRPRLFSRVVGKWRRVIRGRWTEEGLCREGLCKEGLCSLLRVVTKHHGGGRGVYITSISLYRHIVVR